MQNHPKSSKDVSESNGILKVKPKIQKNFEVSVDEMLQSNIELRPSVDSTHETSQLPEIENVSCSLMASVKLERQMASHLVNQLLGKRPEPSELVTQGRLIMGVAPRLMATAKNLEHQRVKDTVGHLLEARPEAEALANIMEHPVSLAPTLHAAKKILERNMKADKISYLLTHRPPHDATMTSHGLPNRTTRFIIALQIISRLGTDNNITLDQKSHLKQLLLAQDDRIMRALYTYTQDGKVIEVTETFHKIATVV